MAKLILYMPNSIQIGISTLMKLFCTSTVLEGVVLSSKPILLSHVKCTALRSQISRKVRNMFCKMFTNYTAFGVLLSTSSFLFC